MDVQFMSRFKWVVRIQTEVFIPNRELLPTEPYPQPYEDVCKMKSESEQCPKSAVKLCETFGGSQTGSCRERLNLI